MYFSSIGQFWNLPLVFPLYVLVLISKHNIHHFPITVLYKSVLGEARLDFLKHYKPSLPQGVSIIQYVM